MGIDTKNPEEVKAWARQIKVQMNGFEKYLRAVERTGKMYPFSAGRGQSGWAQAFFGANGIIDWLDDGLGGTFVMGSHWIRRRGL